MLIDDDENFNLMNPPMEIILDQKDIFMHKS